MPLQKKVSAFDHPDWVFELKYDGFRAFAYIESGECRLMSRNGNQFKSFPFLNLALPLECKAKSAVLDGEMFASIKTAVRSSRTCCFVVASLVSWRLIACIVTGRTFAFCHSATESTG